MIELIIFFIILIIVTLILDIFGFVNPGLDKICEEKDANFEKYKDTIKYDH